MRAKKRLVVVSNRVPDKQGSHAGGLSVALQATLEASGGLWFGWSGGVSGKPELRRSSLRGVDYLTVDLTDHDCVDQYASFSNRALWPLLHSRPDLVEFSRVSWEGYQRVNGNVASALADELDPDDPVWIHDYHLIPLARRLRALGATNRIGFFLHVPFPSIDLITALPRHKDLFSALSAYDLVGFQTSADLSRFIEYMGASHGARCAALISTSGLDLYEVRMSDGRQFRAGSFPISVDTSWLGAQAGNAACDSTVARLKASLLDSSLILGVDRVDYSKGLPARFDAFQAFLEQRLPAGRDTTFLQIAPLSRIEVLEYQQLRASLEGQAGRINSSLSRPDWSPLRYVNQNFDRRTLTGFYRLADVGLVTPLRDGMNLVAKEFVACQDPADPGVLILSCFAGAANELTGALLVNPHDVEEVAEAIAAALAMPLLERQARWGAMMDLLRRWDVHAWARAFLSELGDWSREVPAAGEALIQPRARELRVVRGTV